MPRRSIADNGVLVRVDAAQFLAMREPVWTGYGNAANAAIVDAVFNGRRGWCGYCTKMSRPICVNRCATMIPGQDWCRWCMGVQKSFCAVDCYRERLLNSLSYVGFYARMQASCPETRCSWCSEGAGSWCESCRRDRGPATALCLRCDDTLLACRLCWAENYVRETDRVGLPCVSRKVGSRVCAGCGGSPAVMLCSGCETVAYCSLACQSQEGEHHKPVCAMLRDAIPVLWVYEWQQHRVDDLRCEVAMAGPGALTRFYDCFETYSAI